MKFTSHALPHALIYGAGSTGARLLSAIREHTPDRPVAGFVDDDQGRLGSTWAGLQIVGQSCDIPALLRRFEPCEVLIAIPSLNGEKFRELSKLGAQVQTLPAKDEFDETLDPDLLLRPISIEDVYRRVWPALDPDPVTPMLKGAVAMVTGAGGSIGSQLCRAMARYRPAAIVGLDSSEAGLFALDHELKRRFPGVPFYPEIGNIQNRSRLQQAIDRYSPSIIYHAAAYKHVPMLQGQLIEAVRNNVLGTWDLASVAAEKGVGRLVLVSTDKAVRARNVLGLSKRAAEAAVWSFACAGLDYFAVRLGNVLGSSGSVTQIFQSQIERRLPITLTDPRMTRYFTTVAEASRFLLDASAIGQGGELYSLEMGDAVSIESLARQMISLHKLHGGGEVPVVISGPRAGEEFTEKLFQPGEIPKKTVHPRIYQLDRFTPIVSTERMSAAMETLRFYCDAGRGESLRDSMEELCFAPMLGA